MGGDADSWDRSRGAEAYLEAVRRGTIYRSLADRLLERLVLPRGGRLLDLGCGTGVAAEALFARRPDAVVAGIDRARSMLRTGRAAVPLPSAAFVRAAPERLPFADAVFDGALCSAAFWHFPFRHGVLEETFRTVRKGGRLVLNVPAAQLSDVDDLPAAPLQHALTSEGEREFARPPAPSAVESSRAEISETAVATGWRISDESTFDLRAAQEELAGLLYVPAIGARFYPDAPEEARERWIDAAVARIEPGETVAVRWWEITLSR